MPEPWPKPVLEVPALKIVAQQLPLGKYVCGIYAILHLPSGRVYVGSSKNIRFRCASHCGLLNRNRHPNFRLQAAWNQSSVGEFFFVILEVENDEEKLLAQEQIWIDRLGAADPQLFQFHFGSIKSQATFASVQHFVRGKNRRHSQAVDRGAVAGADCKILRNTRIIG